MYYRTRTYIAAEIKNSEEYKEYKTVKEALKTNNELKEKIAEFEKIRFDVQVTEIQTGKKDEEKIQKMQEAYAELMQDGEAQKYFEAETKFNIIIADINKILGEALRDVAN